MAIAVAGADIQEPEDKTARRAMQMQETVESHAGRRTQVSLRLTKADLNISNVDERYLDVRWIATANNCIPGKIVVPTGRPMGYQER